MSKHIIEAAQSLDDAWREMVLCRNWGQRLVFKADSLPSPCTQLVQHRYRCGVDLRCQCEPTGGALKRRRLDADGKSAAPAPRKWAAHCKVCSELVPTLVRSRVETIRDAIAARVRDDSGSLFLLIRPHKRGHPAYKCMDIDVRLLELVKGERLTPLP